MPLKVYVIIVTFNGIKWIDNCLGSLRNSDYPVQTIVIDNGSTDGTVERINHYKNVELIQSEKNLGFGMANNMGIKKALENECDYIFLLNQDAWIKPDTVGILVDIAEKNSDFGIISPFHLNGSGTALDRQFSTYLEPEKCSGLISDIFLDKEKQVYSVIHVNAAAWLVRKRVFEEVGYFDDLFFMYGEDDNFSDRTKYHGFKIGITPKTCIYHDRSDKESERIEARADYPTQLKRMKRIVLNPNATFKEKQFYFFRKSMSDILLNLKTGNIGASIKNLQIYVMGLYYMIRYHKRYK